MQGGRLYVNLQGLPDRRARIRINTLLNGKPVAEVDLSANHPRMLMALENKKLPENFYDDIAAKTKTTRDQVKFLVTRAIGASNRRVSLKSNVDKKHWHKTDFVITPKQRSAIENAIKETCPLLFEKFYKGMGIYLQGLEGDILMKTMLSLIEQDIPSLPIHDAIYVQKRHASKAKKALETAWMKVLGVRFKPKVKIDKG
jgi:DNA-binding MarR family transcriptional regulator